jgi:peptide-methionine (S)-S-oxide reductase
VQRQTSHAEAVRIRFDPASSRSVSCSRLLLSRNDPTQLDRQGNDVGRQYRSAIFPVDDEQGVAEAYIRQLDAALRFARPIATRLEPLSSSSPPRTTTGLRRAESA